MTIHRIDAAIGKAEKTGTGTRVPIYTGDPRAQMEILHGLGRVPVAISISDKDKFCDFATVSKDKDRHVVVFSETRVNLYMEYQ
jgi:hypothetical protein